MDSVGEGEGRSMVFKNSVSGTLLAVQWLRLYSSIAQGMGLILTWTRLLHSAWHSQKQKDKKEYSLHFFPMGKLVLDEWILSTPLLCII